jgi:hypothetical protein
MTAKAKKSAEQEQHDAKLPHKRKAKVDIVCYRCGALGTTTWSGQLPRNEDGTVRGLCQDCHAFWQNGKTRSGRDLPGQRLLCFNPVQK